MQYKVGQKMWASEQHRERIPRVEGFCVSEESCDYRDASVDKACVPRSHLRLLLNEGNSTESATLVYEMFLWEQVVSALWGLRIQLSVVFPLPCEVH